jgi:glycosyltransferase involved in cell wall biosynthesis
LPLVDVVIPVFNCARFIRESVESALAQDVDARIFVVDAGSSDGSLDEVPRSRAVERIELATTGRSAARNAGVGAGSSPFVAFLDADDYWLPGKLARQVAAIRPAVAIACTDYFEFTPRGILRPALAARRVPYSGRVLAKLLRDDFVKTSTVLVRRAALPEARPFDEALVRGEDRDLFYRIAARHEVQFDPAVLVGVRERPGKAAWNAAQHRRDVARVYEKTLAWLEAPELRAIARRELARCYRDLGWQYATRDLPAALRSYARALRLGALGAARDLMKAPLRRLLVERNPPLKGEPTS